MNNNDSEARKKKTARVSQSRPINQQYLTRIIPSNESLILSNGFLIEKKHAIFDLYQVKSTDLTCSCSAIVNGVKAMYIDRRNLVHVVGYF